MKNFKNTCLTLGKFRELTNQLPDDTIIAYHLYYKGCGLGNYTVEDMWLFPQESQTKTAVVINPASDYDHRASRIVQLDNCVR